MMVDKVEIIEVSPRDGLQNEREILDSATKIDLINQALDFGIKRIEVASFVNPKRVPQMADAEAVINGLDFDKDATYIGLVLNERGAQRALKTNIHELGAVACASDGFAMRNQGQTSLESANIAANIVKMAKSSGKSGQITISTAFGCPFDGETPIENLIEIVKICANAEPREIAIADTIGAASPFNVKSVIKAILPYMGEIPLRVHFHNTRGTGIANAFAAYELGVRRFDSSLGGLGGCPFAPNATGNIATEDLAYMFARGHIRSNIDFDKMLSASDWLKNIMGRKLNSSLPNAGLFPPSFY